MTLKKRVRDLEGRSAGSRVIVVRYPGQPLTLDGKSLTGADIALLEETHDVVVLNVVYDNG